MNQPDLGNYISNLRKEQGLTQEELVEKCNINVRTIQRIEAGEVTPRSYTIKNILEALGSSFDNVFNISKEQTESPHKLEKNKQFILYAIVAGIVYFIASSLEIYADTSYLIQEEKFISSNFYVVIKMVSLIASSVFFFGAYLIGKAYDSAMIKASSLSFIVTLLIFGTIDSFIYVHDFDSHTAYHLGKLIIFGLTYTFLGTGFFLKRSEFRTLGKWTGLSGLIGGICLVTIILVIPAIVLTSAFEILLIILFYQQWTTIKSKNLKKINS